jgi:hypothetical protein
MSDEIEPIMQKMSGLFEPVDQAVAKVKAAWSKMDKDLSAEGFSFSEITELMTGTLADQEKWARQEIAGEYMPMLETLDENIALINPKAAQRLAFVRDFSYIVLGEIMVSKEQITDDTTDENTPTYVASEYLEVIRRTILRPDFSRVSRDISHIKSYDDHAFTKVYLIRRHEIEKIAGDLNISFEAARQQQLDHNLTALTPSDWENLSGELANYTRDYLEYIISVDIWMLNRDYRNLTEPEKLATVNSKLDFIREISKTQTLEDVWQICAAKFGLNWKYTDLQKYLED